MPCPGSVLEDTALSRPNFYVCGIGLDLVAVLDSLSMLPWGSLLTILSRDQTDDRLSSWTTQPGVYIPSVIHRGSQNRGAAWSKCLVSSSRWQPRSASMRRPTLVSSGILVKQAFSLSSTHQMLSRPNRSPDRKSWRRPLTGTR
jgi:hypothetical protein